ncbi:hypothetical protein [Saccharicrinis aurantiacus]|uniref:hypothetical protein n=1 Tax=Saccharicrinis aurantiacus TaxID=1849719 RepID=UPI0024910F62|nr:hypothetical protein [Saccharicrinis aurantiacus]
MKNLLVALCLVLSTSAFAQELNNWQKQKVEKEVTQMTEVMGLSEKQVKKITKIKTAQVIDSQEIGKTVTKGTPEAKKAWQEQGKKFDAQVKKVVSDDQWKKWTSCNQKKPTKTAKKSSLNEKQSKKIEAQVKEMTEIMSLTKQQQIDVTEILIERQQQNSKLYARKKNGETIDKEVYTALSKETNDKLVAATSKNQMNRWWGRNK